MALPTLTKAYNFAGINQRITYVSLLDCSARVMFKVKDQLKTNAGWTVQWSCDGTTGPSSSADHTDRWASSANCQTRSTLAAGAQSWIVLIGPYGDQLLLSFLGASDDIFAIDYSPGGNFAIAGTATNQPTLPTDNMPVAHAITQVGSTTSGDRILQIATSTDGKIVRWWVYRASVMIRYVWREDFDSTGVNLVGSLVFAPPAQRVVVGNDANSNFATGAVVNFGTSGTAGATGSQLCRVNSNNILVGGGGECYLNSTSGNSAFSVAAPELEAAAPIVPLMLASSTTNFQGKLGKRIDAWFPYCSGLTQGDTFGSLQFVAFGSQMVPWDGASTVVIA